MAAFPLFNLSNLDLVLNLSLWCHVSLVAHHRFSPSLRGHVRGNRQWDCGGGYGNQRVLCTQVLGFAAATQLV